MRPSKARQVHCRFQHKRFCAHGNDEAQDIMIGHDLMEALRLVDAEGASQDEAARSMEVSTATLCRILGQARLHVATALCNGHNIIIEGGNVKYAQEQGRHRNGMGHNRMGNGGMGNGQCNGQGRGRGQGQGNGQGRGQGQGMGRGACLYDNEVMPTEQAEGQEQVCGMGNGMGRGMGQGHGNGRGNGRGMRNGQGMGRGRGMGQACQATEASATVQANENIAED